MTSNITVVCKLFMLAHMQFNSISKYYPTEDISYITKVRDCSCLISNLEEVTTMESGNTSNN